MLHYIVSIHICRSYSQMSLKLSAVCVDFLFQLSISPQKTKLIWMLTELLLEWNYLYSSEFSFLWWQWIQKKILFSNCTQLKWRLWIRPCICFCRSAVENLYTKGLGAYASASYSNSKFAYTIFGECEC